MAKAALIQGLMQKDMKLSDEAHRSWSVITDEGRKYEFDRKQRKIVALGNVTLEQVRD